MNDNLGSYIPKNAAVIVAHPDDETLWCGGYILSHPEYSWFIVSMCRKNDTDRSAKFFRVLQILGATGSMGDVDDGPEQRPLILHVLQQDVLSLTPALHYDLILTHAPGGEYTRHRRHEEVSQSVVQLWKAGAISTNEMWLFAYDDNGRSALPRAIENAHQYYQLPEAIWQEKYWLITEIYGFDPESWEARTTPRAEAFWHFTSPTTILEWMKGQIQTL